MIERIILQFVDDEKILWLNLRFRFEEFDLQYTLNSNLISYKNLSISDKIAVFLSETFIREWRISYKKLKIINSYKKAKNLTIIFDYSSKRRLNRLKTFKTFKTSSEWAWNPLATCRNPIILQVQGRQRTKFSNWLLPIPEAWLRRLYPTSCMENLATNRF